MKIINKEVIKHEEVRVQMHTIEIDEDERQLLRALVGMTTGAAARRLYDRLYRVGESSGFPKVQVHHAGEAPRAEVRTSEVTLRFHSLPITVPDNLTYEPIRGYVRRSRQPVSTTARVAQVELSDREVLALRALMGMQHRGETSQLYHELGQHPVVSEARKVLGVELMSEVNAAFRNNEPGATEFNTDNLSKFSGEK